MNRLAATTLAATLVAGSAVPARAQSRFDFDTGRRWFALRGAQPWMVGAGDFDENGVDDIAITDRSSGELTIYWNDRFGNLRLGPSVRVDDTAAYLAVADFDRDGHLDVAVDSLHGGTSAMLTVLYGDGTGGFPRRFTSGVPGLIVGTVLALNLDADGALDLVATCPLRDAVEVFRSNAAGSWDGPTEFAAGNGAGIAASGDFDRDGRVDLVVTNSDAGGAGRLTILAGDGVGGFQPPRSFATATTPRQIAVADLNGDGRLDIVVSHPGANGVSIHDGAGAGGFGPRRTLDTFLWETNDLIVGDFDGDGTVDLAVGHQASDGDRYSMFRGNGAGGFAFLSEATVGEAPADGIALDLNGDSRLDIVAANRLSRDIAVALGTGRGRFGDGTVVPASSGSARDVVLRDFDEDGDLDAAVTRNDANDVAIFRGDGGGGFVAGATFQSGGQSSALVAEDFDRDGHVDLATTDFAGNGVAVLSGDGTGHFGALRHFGAGFAPVTSIAADFDEDGFPDLAVANTGSECTFTQCLADGSVSILRNDGTGSFVPLADISTNTRNDSRLAVGDFDEDGHVDVVVLSGLLNVSLFRGMGSGTFSPGATVVSGANFTGLLAADLDGDGHLDLAIAEANLRSPGFVHVTLGMGNGTFGPIQSNAIREEPRSLAAADFDGDGVLDLAVGCAPTGLNANPICVLAGDGAGGFGPTLEFGVASNPIEMRTTDLDLDGQPDLVLPSKGTQSFTVLYDRTSTFLRCRAGNVNRKVGPAVDTLFVNGSNGIGDERRLIVNPDGMLEIRMEAPPSNRFGPAPFLLAAWNGEPGPNSFTTLPLALGVTAMPTYLTDVAPQRLLLQWNNIGHAPVLGPATLRSRPAPSTVFRKALNGREFTITLQGLIVDRNAPNGRVGVTNGIIVASRRM
ncbi:MAG: VCBS repeat-containing protein [Planctomycetes bacterium]|nr:VCBS repeat-containing protein [Planctomycetota bacterium]MBI3847779.1 VCBS repeat-containing protein [Planctomycetota bacterium]